MELYIFDRELNFKGIIDNFESLQWNRRYFKSGNFELQCALTTDNLNLLQKGNIVYKKGDSEAGYINYRNLKQTEEGTEILIAKGNFLTGYLDRRIIWDTEIINDTAENAMRILVNHNCINPSDTNRVISNLILGEVKGFTQNIKYQVSYKNLADELESLSNTSELGHRVNFDVNSRKILFDVYEGLDRTISQDVNPRCIFSKEFENILEQEYTDSSDNYRNVTLIGGAGEGVDRKFTTVGGGNGLDRFELFTDARDLQNTKLEDDVEVSIPDEEYIAMLQQRGNEKLAETADIQTFDSKINVNSNLKYKTDYDLGDIVTCVSKKWDLILNSRITEIGEVYEGQEVQINITFGNNIPTIMDKIKIMTK